MIKKTSSNPHRVKKQAQNRQEKLPLCYVLVTRERKTFAKTKLKKKDEQINIVVFYCINL
jgi:hypothetical protein